MKKLIMVLTAIVVNVSAAFAQDTFVATLEHNGEYTNFYNTTALTSAYNAAEDGDVITLSAGTFTCPTITKGVSIRGIGLEQLQQGKKTFISNAFDVYSQDSPRIVNIEGLYLQNTMNIYSDGSAESAGTVNIIKTRCNTVNVLEKNSPTAETTTEVFFYNCWLNGEFKSNLANYTDIKFLNSYITATCYTNMSEVSNTMFRNCYLDFNNLNNMNYSSFENCILRFDGYQYMGSYRADHFLPTTATATNSISFTNNNNATGGNASWNHHAFEGISYSENCSHLGQNLDLATVFSDQANFVLQEDFANTYLGTDGKQVGMHGGIGYTTKVRYPIIKNLSIANGQSTTREGILGVTIELDRE